MEEELNEHELEERLYAMLHHVDETQNTVNNDQGDVSNILENAQRSTLRRYWRTNTENNPYQKVNNPKNASPAAITKITPKETNITTNTADNAKPKEEKHESPALHGPVDHSIFQSPVPQFIKKTIEILDHEDNNEVILESSDEDEVVEVALPPKPTITIESSDEDELQVIKPNVPSNTQNTLNAEIKANSGERDVSASPVPSVVSSVSDDFIRGDCIALNISSRHPDNPSFDFSLHGSDLLGQSTPGKKKKKKKTKENTTSTPITTTDQTIINLPDECFATPKGKAKNKKKKSYTVMEKSVPNADVYDSDSNQSLIDTSKNRNTYIVTEKSLPSADVYESDSSQSENIKESHPKQPQQSNDIDSSDSSVSLESADKISKGNKNDKSTPNNTVETVSFIDLTETDVDLEDTTISESIVMGNVTGFMESEDYGDENIPQNNISKFCSTKVPPILNEDLDFDNLKGKDSVCKRRRYSLTTLRAEMEKFYNESWGGEDFNHREIQKNMSRDKRLWMIDAKDRMPSLSRKKTNCHYCNRPGHRDDTCRQKPSVCYMCGSAGHIEPRCPGKICVNCGSPNHVYTTMCRNCNHWSRLSCAECGQIGHPASHCPDMWRRYHNTIDSNTPLEKTQLSKKPYQLYCSGCSRRGHLVHACRTTLPFSGLPINTPYVCFYRPVYAPTPHDNNCQKYNKPQNRSFSQDSTISSPTNIRNERNKRQSKSPTAHENHFNKKRNMSLSSDIQLGRNAKSPGPEKPNQTNTLQKNTSTVKEISEDTNKSKKELNMSTSLDNSRTEVSNSEKAPNFIPIISANHNLKGQIIQDNEVSDTSDVVTSARIYVTIDMIDKLKSKEGEEWLKMIAEKLGVTIEHTNINLFLSIKGKLGDQEAFQAELRDWTKSTKDIGNGDKKEDKVILNRVSKNREIILRQLEDAFKSLKQDLGDPNVMYNQLTLLKKKHENLLKQKVINPKQLNTSRNHINRILTKLNMILIGQAGLADGSNHLNKLQSIKEELRHSNVKIIAPGLRKQIEMHYSIIFAPSSRNDYSDLIEKYYKSKPTPPTVFRKKRKKNAFKLKSTMNIKKNMNSPPPQNDNNSALKGPDGGTSEPNKNGKIKMSKLVFYRNRLMSSRPNGAILKKTREELSRKLHSLIVSTFRNETMSTKALKKAMKVQEQVQLFLANV